MTLAESVEYLFSLQSTGIKLGLDTMRRLCEALGHPEKSVPCVHLAGTNGKGSTAALVEAGLRASGYRTGLYTSPHLVRFAERIRVAGREIPDAELARRIGELRPVLEGLATRGARATFFEATTALAFAYFRDERAAITVLETGLGGRLDSTNVCTPAVTAVTSIGFDHMEFLGDTLEKIAFEKAGIFKPGVPAVVAPLPEDAMRVVRERADEVGAPWIACPEVEATAWDPATGCQTLRWNGVELAVSLPGPHQARNAVTALEILRALGGLGWEVRFNRVRTAWRSVAWPARFEILSRNPPLVLDGGHNAEGVRCALAAWKSCFGGHPGRIVFGCMKDKEADLMVAELAAGGGECWLVPVTSPRSADPQQLAAAATGARELRAWASLAEAREAALTTPHPEGTLVLGSLYLAGEWKALATGTGHQLKLN